MKDPLEDLQTNINSPIYNNDTEFISSDLSECFDHFQETGNTEPLNSALITHYNTKREAIKKVQFLLDYFGTTEKTGITKILTEIKNSLR